MLETIMAAATMLNNATASELRELMHAIDAYDGDDNDALLASSIVSRELKAATATGE